MRAHDPKAERSFTHLNKVIDKLERGLLVTGLYVTSVDPSNALGLVNSNGWQVGDEVYTKAAVDLLLIEMEHEPFNVEKLRNFLLALTSRREVHLKGNLQPNLVPFLMLPTLGDQPLETVIQQVLDMGVFGLYCTVKNADEVRKYVKACRYPQALGSAIAEPRGRRANYPLWASHLWGLTMKEYGERADVWPLNPRGDLMLIIHIETKEGVENIDSMLSVPGIAAAHFGPRDYSFSIGRPLEVTHPEVLAAGQKVKDACERRKIQLIAWADETDIQQYLSEGRHKILIIGTDTDNDFGDSPKWGNRGPGKVIDYLRKRSQ
ncbi:MAG: aldolase/citrate lyase family protein [Acidobacteria bacterium]|nr:aldolase/citrate lyase family protein [Acidobacteriota bacterium]MCI0721631.1 aldolase/citrate lyase family protein [Acidobacteriota bacterium]